MKKITNFLTNPFISGWLLKATAFMVMPEMIINALSYILVLIKYKIHRHNYNNQN